MYERHEGVVDGRVGIQEHGVLKVVQQVLLLQSWLLEAKHQRPQRTPVHATCLHAVAAGGTPTVRGSAHSARRAAV